jgi:hypothetical protein
MKLHGDIGAAVALAVFVAYEVGYRDGRRMGEAMGRLQGIANTARIIREREQLRPWPAPRRRWRPKPG